MYKFIIPAIMIMLGSCKENKDSQVAYDWKSRGDSIVTLTFDTLRNTLLKAIGEKGFPGAVEFCNTEALQLTNTYAAKGIQVKRSSDKLRNPSNAPDILEKELLKYYRQLKEENKELLPSIKKDSIGNLHYFKPILVQTMCLNCHGHQEKNINPETWIMIQKKYPGDKAIDYKEGDLRGLWHIIFNDAER